MSLSASLSRLAVYYQRNGIRATVHRASQSIRRSLFSNRMVLFYCDLAHGNSFSVNLPDHLNVEQRRTEVELGTQDFSQIVNLWNPTISRRQIPERFRQGASLWLVKAQGKLAGFGWTITSRTIEPHYLPLGENDVHLFDFFVLPEYRGRGINPSLVNYMLRSLAGEGASRAFIEAAEWNHAQLSSLRKTPFRLLGMAKKTRFFHHTVVAWYESRGEADQGHGQL